MKKRSSKNCGSKRAMRAGKRVRKDAGQRAARVGAILLTGSFAVAQVPVYAGGSLPVPCAGVGACIGGTGKSLGFDQLGTGSTLTSAASNLTIHQNGNTAIFNWASFNISTGNTVQFIQPSSSSVALNRIFDPNVSTISGNLLANGQIYLVNPNGILFGSGANVNVAGLIASTSNLTDARVTSGLLTANTSILNPLFTDPVFTNNAAVLGGSAAESPIANGNATPAIVVQPGATLYAAGQSSPGTVVSAGRVFLFAPTVENGGSIKVDGGGQVILAAGSDVYLGSSSDASLRGLLVEVDGSTAAGVTVDATGNISVARGNITLMGLAVNQAGTLTATTALDANGSISLIARQANPTGQVAPQDPTILMPVAQTGTVNLASGSKTVVAVDPTDTATAPLNDPTADSLNSTINIAGAAVNIGGNGAPGATLIQAHGGNVTVTARSVTSQVLSQPVSNYTAGDGSLLGASDLNDPSGAGIINVGSDANIDVSGLQNVAVDGSRNFVFISRLTSTNLADAPYQRTGFLLGQGVWVNLANVPSWLDVSSLQQAVAGTQAERDAVGGTIALRAEGTVNLAQGSVLNVSGGSTVVSAAQGRTSQLITASGAVVNISNASADTQYVGLGDQGSYNASDTREGISTTVSWQAPAITQVGGYTQGANAGTVEIYASAATLNGTLFGQTTVGPNQRNTLPLGGQLKIGSDNALLLDSEAGIQRPNILLVGSAAELGSGLSPTLAANTSGPTIALNTTALSQGGFDRFDLTSDGVIELAPGTPLNLGPNGQFIARGNAIAINASIVAPGGTVSLGERPLTVLPLSDSAATDESNQRDVLSLVPETSSLRGSVNVSPGITISTAGLWTNDTTLAHDTAPSAPVVLNGGSISISGRSVDVAGANFDVSSGAWLTQGDQFNGGAGGSLSLSAMPSAPALVAAPTSPLLVLGSDFASHIAGFGATQGGSLSISAWSIQLGTGSAADPSTVVVDPAVGSRGFQSFQFTGYQQAAVSADTQFAPQPLFFQNSAALSAAPSNSSLLAVAMPQAALPGKAVPVSIGLKAGDVTGGIVTVDTGAVLNAGTEGSISINGFDNVLVDGSLLAPAGSVALALGNADQSGSNYPFTLTTLQSRSIQLGPDALIDVSGVSLAVEQTNGLKTGSVLSAGSVSLDAPLGTVAVDPGARILATGASDTIDVLGAGGQYQPQLVNSSGGTIEISAANAIYLEGQIQAQGSGSANGGSLSLALNAVAPITNDIDQNVYSQLGSATNLSVTSSLPPLVANQAAFPVPTGQGAQGAISPSTINGSGFEQVWLQSADTITLAQSMTLGTNPASASAPYALNSLVLSSQALSVASGSNAILNAAYIALGPAAQLSPSVGTGGHSNFAVNPPVGTSGSGSLQVNAGQLDLVGNLALQNIGQATLNSTGDIRGLGVQSGSDPSRYTGGLSFGGNLALNAAQLYPATQTDYTIAFAPTGTAADATNGQLQITVAPQDNAPLAPMSAGGSLTFNVNAFTSSGRVEAPLGTIAINANSISLGGSSVLSIAGNGLVLYGEVYNGTTWTYGVPTGNSAAIDPYTLGSASGTALPAKGISLNAPGGVINAQAGSTINLAGGGDVLGDGFVAGPGGAYDMSLNFPYGTNLRNPYFALVPSRGVAAAPYDPQTYADLVLDTGLPSASNSVFAMGETITIAAGSSIPAGTYTVMPPRYALLPGAYAVEAAIGYSAITPATPQTLPDGTVVVAGKLGFADAGTSASLWSAFRIYNATQFRTLSQFEDYYGSQFFTIAATDAGQVAQRLGQDAGSLQVDAGSILLASTMDAAPSSGGRGAEIAIDAPSIVVGDFAQATSASATLQLNAASLTRLDAETLILGATDPNSLTGIAAQTGNVINLSSPVTAQSVTVQASTPLSAGQVLLAAANVSVTGGSAVVANTTQTPTTTAINVSGDGAALYAGNVAASPLWTRTPASAPGTATLGNLSVASGASIQGNSVLFDATAVQSFDDGLSLQASNLNLSAAVVNLGFVPAGTSGLNLSAGLLNTFSTAHNLTITSLGGIDVYGTAAIGRLGTGGAPTLDRLTLVGPGISGFGAASDSLTVTAGHVTLDNSAGASIANPGSGAGALAINTLATSIDDGNIAIAGSVSLGGVSAVSLSSTGRVVSATQTASATGDLVFTGSVGATPGLVVGGTATTLAIDSTRITAQRGVDATISVPGALTIAASGPAQSAEQSELGASLTVTAQNVAMGGRIDLPAGVVSISATGPAAGDGITLASGSSIRVAGVTQQFASTTADVSAGVIALSSASGSVVQDAGASLDLGGAGTEGDAGSLRLSAPSGTVALNGTVLATPGTNASGANFLVDAASVGNLSTLIATFNAASGTAAANSIDVRARNGNLTVQSADQLTASSITLEADGGGGASDGSIQIAGTLNASGVNGGSIALYANDQVVLQSGAQLNASATSSNGNGGEVLISSRIVVNPAATPDAIVLNAGSSINVAGGSAGNGGTVILRAPQISDNGSTTNNDVAITAAAGTVTGALGTVSSAPNAAILASTGINEEIIEAVNVYSETGNVALDPSAATGVLATAQTDAQNFMSAALAGGVNAGMALTGYSLRPGIQIATPGSISIASATPSVASLLDFAATNPNTGAYLWRYGGSTLATSTPGALSLVAGGGINVRESISDGFGATTPGSKTLNSTVAASGDSWSYILTAGAELTAANPNQTTVNAGQPGANLTVGTASATKPAAIRTGTGSIALNASQDVVLNNGASQQGNVVYTAGVANVAAVDGSGNPLTFPVLTSTVNNTKNTVNVALTQYGGNLNIAAGRDVLGTDGDLNQDGSTQSVNDWLLRGGEATAAAPTVWFVDFAQFQQGFGALGGGNLDLSAGRNVVRVGAVVASNGYDAGSGVSEVNTGALNISATGTVEQGLFYNQAGNFRMSATTFASNPNSQNFGSIRLAQGSNDLVIQARESAEFDPSFNPTISAPALINVGNSSTHSKNASASWQQGFLTYDSNSTLDVRVAGGDLILDSYQNNDPALSQSFNSNFRIAAPNLQLAAFGGSITASAAIFGEVPQDSNSSIVMAPSATGQVRILADGSITNLSVMMSQADPAVLAQASGPQVNTNWLDLTTYSNSFKGQGGASLHVVDPTTGEIVARSGSISGYFSIPKTTEIVAGGQIGGSISTPTIINLQNDNANSVSTVSSGQGMSFVNGNAYEGITVGGPGVLQVIAGGSINLGGTGQGIVSRGNLDDSNLNPVGATLIVVAGAGRSAGGAAALPDYTSVIDNFVQFDAFASTGTSSPALNQQVLAALASDPSLAPLVQALQAGLANRISASEPNSTFNQDLAKLTPAQLAIGAVRLASAIQVVNNQLFVNSNNSETFAPAYVAFADLFPNLNNNAQAIRQFVLANIFANANNGAALQAQALQGLPAALASLIQLGLSSPASVNQAGSAFSQALAAMDPTTLASGMRQLMANVLTVAGSSEVALQAAGRLTGSGSPYAKALTAFAQAYAPATPAGLNDLQMDYSEIKTEQSGDVAFFAPQGAVVVGQSSPPSFAATKAPDQLGIFTYGGGDIIGMARDSVDVYRSRVFTVAGGDIDLWSSLADLDAGRGPRDIAVVPPPTLVIDSNGVEQLDLSATVTGSGIGALVTQPDQPPSNINLMAPAGYVDAGEAGIRAQSGTVTLGTNLVLNAGNISAASGVSGGAVVATPAPPLPPSAGGSVADQVVAETQREAMAQQQAAAVAASQRRMRLVGEFIGFDDCDAASRDSNGNCPSKNDN